MSAVSVFRTCLAKSSYNESLKIFLRYSIFFCFFATNSFNKRFYIEKNVVSSQPSSNVYLYETHGGVYYYYSNQEIGNLILSSNLSHIRLEPIPCRSEYRFYIEYTYLNNQTIEEDDVTTRPTLTQYIIKN